MMPKGYTSALTEYLWLAITSGAMYWKVPRPPVSVLRSCLTCNSPQICHPLHYKSHLPKTILQNVEPAQQRQESTYCRCTVQLHATDSEES